MQMLSSEICFPFHVMDHYEEEKSFHATLPSAPDYAVRVRSSFFKALFSAASIKTLTMAGNKF